MSPHPPLMQKLAQKPVVVSFTFDTLTVRCPDCQAERTWQLRDGPPAREPYCPKCGRPWKWE